MLTLGPHAFYWFALQRPPAEVLDRRESDAPPVLRVTGEWERVLAPRRRAQLEAVLLSFIRRRLWFAGKHRATRSLRVAEIVRLASDDQSFAVLVVVEIDYREGEPERYVLPLALLEGENADAMLVRRPHAVVAFVTRGAEHAVVVDGLAEPEFCRRLLEVVARRRRHREGQAQLASHPSRELRALLAATDAPLEPALPDIEQTNSSVVFGNRLILKFFRRLQEGVNPELEIGAALAQSRFENTASVLGSLDLTSPCVPRGGTLAVLHEIVPNDRDAWSYTLDELGRFYERALTDPEGGRASDVVPATAASLLALADGDLPPVAHERAGEYLWAAELIGRRTAELHIALAGVADPAFTPQVFTPSYQRSMYQSMRNRTRRSLTALARTVSQLPEEDRALAADVLASEPEILDRFRALLGQPLTGLRTRVHGDFHLERVLHTGRDFTIIDFEGEPSTSVSQRRLRRSPLRDVASMLRSFDYATHAAARDEVDRGVVDRGSEGARLLEEWGRRWTSWVSASLLRGYLGAEGIEQLLPDDRNELELVLDALVLDKALDELGFEIEARPDWVHIPLKGILSLPSPTPTEAVAS